MRFVALSVCLFESSELYISLDPLRDTVSLVPEWTYWKSLAFNFTL
ncbi:unnamed protein product [Brassica oleracea var. botrytis]